MAQHLKLKKMNFRTDIPVLFDVINSTEVQRTIIHKPPINTLPEFDEWLQLQLKGFFHDFYSITDVNEFEYAGCIYSYDFSYVDLNCKVALNVLTKFYDSFDEIFDNFCKTLFTQYPLHKIFCLVQANNPNLIELLKRNNFEKEGEFKEYRFIDGKYVNLYIYSVKRADIIQILQGQS